MSTSTMPTLKSGGIELETGPDRFGFLLDSNDVIEDAEALKSRMDRDGYLFLPGFFDRDPVYRTRLAFCDLLAEDGRLDPEHPRELAIAGTSGSLNSSHDIAKDPVVGAKIREVIYNDKIMGFFGRFLGGEATHFDYTWVRAIEPGLGSYPHCDVIFMGRGSKNLYTCWVPFGDIPLNVGGLLLIEGSHKDQEIRRTYASLDIDTACANRNNVSEVAAAGYPGYGALSLDFRATRDRVGGRLLTAEEYRMGDLLIFNVYLVHGSLDNQSKEIRLSTDSRYQLASEPLDDRWVGEDPPGHGGNSVKGLIC
ncbi:MAG: phytanoyl-CoA dioxygenase family protein [Fimbriimonas sp.]|nr:phytanoyl-CoA dioxygenase family protein [Fimbriimonas sp.]